MRCIFVGTEYVGKSTLIRLLQEYYQRRQQRVHVDDHFSLPDATLSSESQAAMVGFPEDVKERMQRMQTQYHIEVIRSYPHVLISGWHLEEAVYCGMYGDDPDNPYYSKYGYGQQRLHEALVLEARLPDLVLIHMVAADAVIGERLEADPHEYQIIRKGDIPELSRRFATEVGACLFTAKGRKIELDTTGKTPQESLDELLLLSEPLITAGELALRSTPIPEGEYEVQYENGVRKLIPSG